MRRSDGGYQYVDLTSELTPYGQLPPSEQGEFGQQTRFAAARFSFQQHQSAAALLSAFQLHFQRRFDAQLFVLQFL